MKRRFLILALTVFLACLLIGNVDARGGVFVIEPMQTATERIELQVSDKAAGNLFVSGGFIDLYVTSPSGEVLLRRNRTRFSSFNFTAKENGNYTFHLLNMMEGKNITATLYYGLERTVVLNAKISVNFDISTGVEKLAPLPPIPDPDIDLENLYERYLNFLKGQEILEAVSSVWKYMTLQNSLLVLVCCIATFGFCCLTKSVHALK